MKQSGFTLVELAIVLVIIGLILGGILSGQSLIVNAKTKDAIVIAEDLRTASLYFKQRYKYLPGDLPLPFADITATPPLVAGTGGTIGNGLIEGAIGPTGLAAAGSEVAEAPWQLFNAGLIGKINTDTQRRIMTSYGAVHMVSNAIANGLIPTYGNTAIRNVVLFVNLPCDIVTEMDIKLDDAIAAAPLATGGRAKGNACTVATDTVNYYAVPL